jgi:ribosome silencing factor RsfS/YbeB/iojap
MSEKNIKQPSAKELAEYCAAIANDRKAENVKILEMSKLSVMSDYFVLCTANSEPHIRAISNRIGKDVRDKFAVRPKSVEGTPASEWILMDYFSVLVHIMTPAKRDTYQLESLWGDAPEVEAVKTLEAFVTETTEPEQES